jgi:hypothetical protein
MTALTTQAASGRGVHTRFLLSGLALLAAALLLPLSGCNNLLKINDPDIVTPGNLNDPSVLPTIRAGAIGDFDLGYTGSGAQGSGGVEGIIMTSGMLGDEWVNSETFPDRIATDARRNTTDNASMQTIFRNLQRGRRATEFAATNYATLLADPTTNSGYAEMLALSGYTYVFLAENYCSGVPVSQSNADGSLVYGTPLTTAQLYDTAMARFTLAVASTANASIVDLALVGMGRAQNDLGQFAAAATTVAAIPVGFAYTVAHDENTTRQNNGVFQANVTNERYSVADKEGINGFSYRTVADRRTPFIRTPASDVGFDGKTPQYDNLRYGDRSATVTVATGTEALLITAEAALQAGDTLAGGGFLAALNAPRQAVPVITYFDSNRPGVLPVGTLAPLTAADIVAAGGAVNLLFAERARWLWLTAHRLSDMRRLIRQYGRATESVFPTGAYFKPPYPTYGTDVNFPVPIDELNNPNFVTCIDRNP